MRRTIISTLIISGLIVQQGCETPKGPINPKDPGAVARYQSATNTNMRASVEEMPATNTEYETTMTESGGVKTETRVYRNASRISRVVITTRDGKRTARVYSVSGELKEIRANDLDNVLAKGGDAIADAVGFVGDKAEDVGGKAKDISMEAADKAEDAAGMTTKRAKTVGREVADEAEDVGGAVASGAKTAGKKTVQGAKKVGGAIKDAITP